MKRSTWILLVILGLLIIATLLVFQRPGETSSSGLLGETLVQLDSAAIDRIDITSPSGEVSIVREGARWMLTTPAGRYPADESAVATAVGAASRLELRSLVSSNPEKQHLFQVDSSGTSVRLFDHGTERAAIRVGKAGSSYTGTYVRQEASDEVYLADGVISHLFNRKPENWRDKRILTTREEEIERVGFQYGDTTFTLALQDSVWRVDGIPAVDPTVKSFLGSLSRLVADAFVDSSITLPEPVASLDVDGTKLTFHPSSAPNKYYIRASSGPQIFEVYAWRVTQVLKRMKDFLGSTPQ